jgi:transcription elongation factor Elf1
MKKQLGEIRTTLLEKVIYINCPRCNITQPIVFPREGNAGVHNCSICDALFEWEIKDTSNE